MAIHFDKLQQQLSYQFSDPELAKLALTHRSASRPNNERLEFLGDSLLGLIVAEALFELYPDASEGELSRMRASMVNKSALAAIARQLELGEFILLGAGESKSGGRDRDSILADAFEALVAAIYLDAGMDRSCQIVTGWMQGQLQGQARQKDAKTSLQEAMQARGLPLPSYKVVEISGEAHRQTFHVECSVASLSEKLKGTGSSKRIAEQEAAARVLALLEEA